MQARNSWTIHGVAHVSSGCKRPFQIKKQERRGVQCANFLLRADLSKEEQTKWLHNKSVAWKKKRRLIQAITLTFPCSKSGYAGSKANRMQSVPYARSINGS